MFASLVLGVSIELALLVKRLLTGSIIQFNQLYLAVGSCTLSNEHFIPEHSLNYINKKRDCSSFHSVYGHKTLFAYSRRNYIKKLQFVVSLLCIPF